MKLSDLIGRLEGERKDLALSALETPSERDVFEYGRVVGMVAGLQRAADLVDEMLSEDTNRRNNF